MSGIYGSYMEDRHFEGLLMAYLDKAEKEDEYDEMVAERIKDITKERADYYPFSAENFGEALNELKDVDLKILSILLATADSCNGNDDTFNGAVYKALSDAVKEYWYDAAKKHVEGLL